jgi:hypothetical protein
MITRLKLSTIEQGLPKYRSMLAGNDAYKPPSFESIASATGTGSSGTITFSSIPATYTSLQIRGIIRGSFAASSLQLGIQINGLTSASYPTHGLRGDGSAASAVGYTAQNYIYGPTFTGSTATSSVCGIVIIDIHDYASTTRNKTIRAIGGHDLNGSGNVQLWSGLYNDTTSITSISLSPTAGGNFTTETQFALYGVKGA